MKKTMLLFLAFASSLLFADAPKYVFVFIGDGMSVPQRMVAEEYSQKLGKGKLILNHLSTHATTRTCSATSLVTDSAASGTAIACGVKTYNGAIGVDADKNKVESMAEAAKKAGRKVGIVTTVTLSHATPSAFYAHRQSRGLVYQIALDLINSDFEYFAGGGLPRYNDKKDDEYCGNIFELARSKGYKVLDKTDEFRKLKPSDGKVIYTAKRDDSMLYTIDNDGSEPTLAELTAKGIEMLDNPKGFFMMVEGGKIDYAGHGNDAATNLADLMALNDAVNEAMKFAKKHKDEVLIIVTGDHETGGMTMGVAGTGYALHIDRLKYQKCSIEKFKKIYKAEAKRIEEEEEREMVFADAKKLLEKWFSFDFSGKSAADDKAAGDKFAKANAVGKGNPMAINKKELEMLEEAFKDGKLPVAARQIINNKSGVGWTTGAHTALPVLTTCYGKECERFAGFLDNTDIGKTVKKLYKSDD
ncbi:MAG: alkaline phosphatase [Kiritimatiellae bacterium]|nr:alkaline phosphatase [Kiritimatiellia bacterium]